MDVMIIQSLAEVDESAWNQLGEADYPFTRHAFLVALEEQHCLLEFGWQPVYFLLKEGATLVAAIPCYIKSNSYGELVFDHSWAQAYERSGLQYYPKLVSAIPYTPATGPRFLIQREIQDSAKIHSLQIDLIRTVKQFCMSHALSGWHVLFERETVVKALADEQLLYRYDCQFHWENRQYANFDDFLAQLNSRKRKNIRKERATVAAEDLTLCQKYGDQLTDAEWQRVHQLYAGIFERKYGTATLSEGFFRQAGRQLKQRVMVVLALKQEKIIAASLFFISDSTLFGRLWGCDEYYNHLHFECCYYQGIDYCIEHKLQRFDPGAQGEHKISRGFLPQRTCSAHWFPDPDFQQAIRNYLLQEEPYMNAYCADMQAKSPYRKVE